MRQVWSLLGVLILAGATYSTAVPLVSLSSPDTLDMLVVGQPVMVDVRLSGLNAGDAVAFLAASVEVDAALVSTPTIAEGAIAPDVSGFLGAGFADLADGSYDAFFAISGNLITTNGVFYTFTVTAQTVGTGAFAFTFVDSSAQDSLGQLLPSVSAGNTLPFTITTAQSPAPVPEPDSWLLCATGLLGLLGYRCRQRLQVRVFSQGSCQGFWKPTG